MEFLFFGFVFFEVEAEREFFFSRATNIWLSFPVSREYNSTAFLSPNPPLQ